MEGHPENNLATTNRLAALEQQPRTQKYLYLILTFILFYILRKDLKST